MLFSQRDNFFSSFRLEEYLINQWARSANAQGRCLRYKRWPLALFQAFVSPDGVCYTQKKRISERWKIPWRRAWQPPPVFLPRECHGQRSLEGYSLLGHKESDATEANQHTCICRWQENKGKGKGFSGHLVQNLLPKVLLLVFINYIHHHLWYHT